MVLTRVHSTRRIIVLYYSNLIYYTCPNFILFYLVFLFHDIIWADTNLFAGNLFCSVCFVEHRLRKLFRRPCHVTRRLNPSVLILARSLPTSLLARPPLPVYS